MLEIRTLGGLSIKEDGATFEKLQTRKAEAILVYLAVEGGEHRRDAVSAMLWPEKPEEQARTSLRVALSDLRKQLGRYLSIDRVKLAIRPNSNVYVDANDLIAKTSNGNYQDAISLYRGDFLAGFHVRGGPDFDQWRSWENEHLFSEILDALHKLIEQAFLRKNFSESIEFARHLVKLDPIDERAYWYLMSALAMDGQRTSALAVYHQCEQVLRSELNIRPNKELEELYKQLSQGHDSVSRSGVTSRRKLPIESNKFVGRQKDIQSLYQQLFSPDCQLICVIGPGGIGKTRLAVQLARRASLAFPDGVGFTSLEAVSSKEMLILAVAEALGFSFDSVTLQVDPKDQLLDYLSNKKLLLILDSYENLVSDNMFLVEAMKCSPNSKLLVTSRERLNLRGEWVYYLDGLPIPTAVDHGVAEEAAALALFIDRMRQGGFSQALTSNEINQAADICRLVEGMPLAIELAAAWTPVLSLAEIKDEINRSLDFLVTPLQDVPGKHRSLRVVFDQSWSLLSSNEQNVFSNLSVFRGGFDRSAAREVAGADISLLLSLYGKSLIRRSAADRFDMHGLLRIFAAEQLDAVPQRYKSLMDRYCQHYLGSLLRNEPKFISPSMVRARFQIRNELNNVQRAVNWSVVHGELDSALEALRAYYSFYVVHGWFDGVIAFSELAKLIVEERHKGDLSDAEEDPVYLSTLAHKAFFCSELGMIAESEAAANKCLGQVRRLDMFQETSLSLMSLGVSSSYRGDYQKSIEQLKEAIEIGRKSTCIAWPAYYLWLGYTHFLRGNYQLGMQNYQICNQLFLDKESSWGQAFALSKMALAATALNDSAQAIKYNRQALAIFEETRDLEGQAYTFSRMSIDAYRLGEYEEALRRGIQAYELFNDVGHRWGSRIALCRTGYAYLGLNEISKAEEYLGEALRTSIEDLMVPIQLYAILGYACAFSIQGRVREALDLFLLAKKHPRTPAIYIDLALRWLPDDAAKQVIAEPQIKDEDDLQPALQWALNSLLQNSSVGEPSDIVIG
ncbi:MAG: BTAD domain-containing putative transcriptional regulator [Candidatus Promineifilaceae bacterium]|jgi:DNA-binding SARP family transcriptional activator/tetratricopeptide (TPR) repeat protein